MRNIAMVASKEVTADGDVIFLNKKKVQIFDNVVYIPNGNILHCTQNGLLIVYKPNRKLSLKLLLLWFWHMVVLGKSHVYLTGVNK